MAIRPKTARTKKSSAKKPVKKSPAKKRKKAGARKKKSASHKKAGKKKASHRKGPRKASAGRPASTSSGGRRPKRDAATATKSHPAKIARLYPKRIGTVSHYYPHAEAALIRLEAGEIHVGDAVHIRGHTTDFYERIEELRVDDQSVERAKSGQTVGVKLSRTVRESDSVYLLSN